MCSPKKGSRFENVLKPRDQGPVEHELILALGFLAQFSDKLIDALKAELVIPSQFAKTASFSNPRR